MRLALQPVTPGRCNVRDLRYIPTYYSIDPIASEEGDNEEKAISYYTHGEKKLWRSSTRRGRMISLLTERLKTALRCLEKTDSPDIE
jgi:hypothetical protein